MKDWKNEPSDYVGNPPSPTDRVDAVAELLGLPALIFLVIAFGVVLVGYLWL